MPLNANDYTIYVFSCIDPSSQLQDAVPNQNNEFRKTSSTATPRSLYLAVSTFIGFVSFNFVFHLYIRTSIESLQHSKSDLQGGRRIPSAIRGKLSDLLTPSTSGGEPA